MYEKKMKFNLFSAFVVSLFKLSEDICGNIFKYSSVGGEQGLIESSMQIITLHAQMSMQK